MEGYKWLVHFICAYLNGALAITLGTTLQNLVGCTQHPWNIQKLAVACEVALLTDTPDFKGSHNKATIAGAILPGMLRVRATVAKTHAATISPRILCQAARLNPGLTNTFSETLEGLP